VLQYNHVSGRIEEGPAAHPIEVGHQEEAEDEAEVEVKVEAQVKVEAKIDQQGEVLQAAVEHRAGLHKGQGEPVEVHHRQCEHREEVEHHESVGHHERGQVQGKIEVAQEETSVSPSHCIVVK